MTAQELSSIVDLLRSRERPQNPSVAEMRTTFERMAQFLPAPTDTQVTPVDAGGTAAEMVAAPGSASARTILYLHGGGYVIGSVRTHRGLAYGLSRAADARVLLLDYRLAPEHPFPAALEDAKGAYRWLLPQDIDPASLAIAGDSAGGGLALATLMALKEEGTPLPACGLCVSPWTDLALTGASMEEKAADDPMVQRDAVRRLADFYLAGADPHTPQASPLYGDLSGLPPLLIQVGTAETLLDDARRVAERAEAAGVDVTLETWPDMIHVWHLFAPILSEGRDAIEQAGAWLRQRWD